MKNIFGSATQASMPSRVAGFTRQSYNPVLVAIHCILIFTVIAASAETDPVDFYMKVNGPASVVRGHNLYLAVGATVTAGIDNSQVTPIVTGLPPNATIKWVTNCCGSKLWRLQNAYPLRVTTDSNTPPGDYQLQITFKTDSGVSRSIDYTVSVLKQYALTPRRRAFGPDTPLPYRAQWESNMILYGLRHCQKSTGIWEGFAWYYDGARVYYQITDYTKNTVFDTCARHELNLYRDYVVQHNGGIPRYRFFAQGLLIDYYRSRENLSAQAVSMLGNFTLLANPAWRIDPSTTRELAFEVQTEFTDEALGVPLDWFQQDRIEMLIGHFDQWFLSRKAQPQPFMVALAAEALIMYHERSGDARIPALIQLACDELWKNHWNATQQGFHYYNSDGSFSVAHDLNLLIVPLFGWTYRNTGNPMYRDQGDSIFTGGVTRAWLGGGKQFSQNYRWSFKYLEWRTPPAELTRRAPIR